jgi:hypothetical protein
MQVSRQSAFFRAPQPYRHNRSRIILNDSYWTFQWAREEGVPDSMEGILYLVADSVVRIALISPQNIQDWVCYTPMCLIHDFHYDATFADTNRR